ncbi:MAG: carbohydrate ABC transporter permease [Bacillus subtilis]|nr:carbohydrate ABC transporter permease [Bacillus subtilis]
MEKTPVGTARHRWYTWPGDVVRGIDHHWVCVCLSAFENVRIFNQRFGRLGFSGRRMDTHEVVLGELPNVLDCPQLWKNLDVQPVGDASSGIVANVDDIACRIRARQVQNQIQSSRLRFDIDYVSVATASLHDSQIRSLLALGNQRIRLVDSLAGWVWPRPVVSDLHFDFYQFFRMQPVQLDESAEIDGANPYQIFLRIGVPLAAPAFLTAFLFSFVWYWNETYISSLFLGQNLYTLQLRLINFQSAFNVTQGLSQAMVNESIRYAATILIILPVLITYLVMQKWFVEGIDRTGVTGE